MTSQCIRIVPLNSRYPRYCDLGKPVPRVPVSNRYRTYQSVGYRYRKTVKLEEVSGTGIEKIPNLPKCQITVSRPYRTNTRTPGIPVEGLPVPGVPVSYHTEINDASGVGIEFVPTLTGVFGRVMRQYTTFRYGSVGYFPSKNSRYTFVLTLQNIAMSASISHARTLISHLSYWQKVYMPFASVTVHTINNVVQFFS